MMRAMNDESLARAAGGNFGDWEIEWKTGTPLYREGDVVEVYTSHLMHFFTKRHNYFSLPGREQVFRLPGHSQQRRLCGSNSRRYRKKVTAADRKN